MVLLNISVKTEHIIDLYFLSLIVKTNKLSVFYIFKVFSNKFWSFKVFWLLYFFQEKKLMSALWHHNEKNWEN